MPLCHVFLNCSQIPSGYEDGWWIGTSGPSSVWNCSTGGSCGELADNDIAGLGVLLAFTVSAAVTLWLAWMAFIFDAPQNTTTSSMHYFDKHFLKWVCFQRDRPKLPAPWGSVIQKIILFLSDSQLVTGFAILTAGFTQACRLSIYHFTTLVYLGWLCSTTHMITLTILRGYFQAHRPVLYWRLLGMATLFVLLFIALILTGSSHGPVYHVFDKEVKGLVPDTMFYFDSPIVCSWQHGYLNNLSADSIISVCILTFGFVARVIKLFEASSELCKKNLRDVPGSWLKHCFDLNQMKLNGIHQARKDSSWLHLAYYRLGRFITMASYVHGRAICDLYGSFISELTWLTLSFFWGVAKVFSYRSFSPIAQYEDKWSFGQLLPLLLLLLPFISLPEVYAEARESESAEGEGGEGVQHCPHQSTVEPRQHVVQHPPNPPTGEPRQHIERMGTVTIELGNSLQTAPLRPLALRKPDIIYKSRTFQLLLFIYGGVVAGPFLYLVILQSTGSINAGRTLLEPIYGYSLWLGLLCAPTILWLLLLAPYSRLTRPDFGDFDE